MRREVTTCDEYDLCRRCGELARAGIRQFITSNLMFDETFRDRIEAMERTR